MSEFFQFEYFWMFIYYLYKFKMNLNFNNEYEKIFNTISRFMENAFMEQL